MTKKPGRRLRRNQTGSVSPKVHPLAQIHGWNATSAWYKSFGADANYRKAMSKLMDRHRGVGAIVYSVERAIEAQFPAATEEEWHTVAHHIVYDVIHPVPEGCGIWRIYPITNADEHFGPRQSDWNDRRGEQDG